MAHGSIGYGTAASDEVLMEAFRDGDEAAFAKLYERYRSTIFRFVWRRIGDPGRAEEIAADVFLAVVERRASWRTEARFRAYLYRIATNRCISELQRAERRFVARPHPRDCDDAAVPDAVAGGESPFEAAAGRELAVRLTLAVGQLSEEFRAPILMELDERGRDEIAAHLGIPIQTVKTRIFRARRKLYALLADAA
jgi:RNA polymerase sigma-70 factor (ECF subfamily)